jgi:hypothetical protein
MVTGSAFLAFMCVLPGCKTDSAQGKSGGAAAGAFPESLKDQEPPAAAARHGVSIAVNNLDAPGDDIGKLTRLLDQALIHTSGMDTVLELDVKNELASCVSPPCDLEKNQLFIAADFILYARATKIADSFLVTAEIYRSGDTKAIRRVSYNEGTVEEAVVRAGWVLGAVAASTARSEGIGSGTAPSTDASEASEADADQAE